MKQELKWQTEEQMQLGLKKRIDEWKEGQSKDGHILRAEGKFTYKGIAYLIRVLRYFNHTNKFVSMGLDRISDCHVVVEYPEETEKLVEAIKSIEEYSEFLYHDTLHSHNDNQTVEQQLEECYRLAKGDIDNIPNLLETEHRMITKIREKFKIIRDAFKEAKQ